MRVWGDAFLWNLSLVRNLCCVLTNKKEEETPQRFEKSEATEEGGNRIGAREGEQSDEWSVLYVGRGVCNFSAAPESKLCAWYYSGSGSLRGRREAEQAWPFFGRTAHWSVCHSIPGVFPSVIWHSRSVRKGHTSTTRQRTQDALIWGVAASTMFPLLTYLQSSIGEDTVTGSQWQPVVLSRLTHLPSRGQEVNEEKTQTQTVSIIIASFTWF